MPQVTGDPNAIEDLVALLYRIVLGREADEGGLAHYAGRLRASDSLLQVLREFSSSEEAVNRRVRLSSLQLTNFVRALYRFLLGREADENGLANYVNGIEEGVPLEEVLAAFVTSTEFIANCRRAVIAELRSGVSPSQLATASFVQAGESPQLTDIMFPASYVAPGEAGKTYAERRESGFLQRYLSGPLVLDVGFAGQANPSRKTALPHAIGVDLDYPGYDGLRLPFDDASVDAVFSSHCLQHILYDGAVICDWFRVLKIGGFVVCCVPAQMLFEKRTMLPSRFDRDHKHMYTVSRLAAVFEAALRPNAYRVRHLRENDRDFDYNRGPDQPSSGCYDIEIVVEKIHPPSWELAR